MASAQFFLSLKSLHPTSGGYIKCWCIFPRAPVKSVVYDTPYTRATQADINLVVELYRTDLEVVMKCRHSVILTELI